jgi:SRSO17 transposase
MIALAFLQSQRLKQAKGGKKNRRTATAAQPASRATGNPPSTRTAAANAMPALPENHQQ